MSKNRNIKFTVQDAHRSSQQYVGTLSFTKNLTRPSLYWLGQTTQYVALAWNSYHRCKMAKPGMTPVPQMAKRLMLKSPPIAQLPREYTKSFCCFRVQDAGRGWFHRTQLDIFHGYNDVERRGIYTTFKKHTCMFCSNRVPQDKDTSYMQHHAYRAKRDHKANTNHPQVIPD